VDSRYDEKTLPAYFSQLQAAAEGSRAQPHLVALTGPGVGSIFRLTEPETVIGRSGECDIHIDDESISREHVKLVRTDDGGFLIKDLESTNGTFKGGQKVEIAVLAEGERFRIGATTLVRLSLSEEVEESFRRLHEASVRDPLTGLHNRRHLLDRLAAELGFCARHGAPLSVVLVDIDHFKDVNDAHGHAIGDQVLVKIGDLLTGSVRIEDLVARYGGEEFVVLAPGIGEQQSVALAERLRETIGETALDVQGERIAVTVSAGVACCTVHDERQQPPDLIGLADEAMYEAKRQGRNKVVLSR